MSMQVEHMFAQVSVCVIHVYPSMCKCTMSPHKRLQVLYMFMQLSVSLIYFHVTLLYVHATSVYVRTSVCMCNTCLCKYVSKYSICSYKCL